MSRKKKKNNISVHRPSAWKTSTTNLKQVFESSVVACFSMEDLEEFWCCKLVLCFFVVFENSLQRIGDPISCVIVFREWNDEGEGLDDGKWVEQFVGRRIVLENVVNGKRDPQCVIWCFWTMKTFQNRGEGFDVWEEDGRLLISCDFTDQAAELINRFHARRDVVEDEIVKIIDSKERTQRVRVKKWSFGW